MLNGFKEFILRGNVIDLAVAVVIGAAFTGIVTGLVEGVLDPVLALLFDADSLDSAGVVLRPARGDDAAIVLSWGRVLSAVIQFLLVAVVLYFALVLPMNQVRRRREEPAEQEAPAAPTETELLTEIRDLLVSRRAAP